MVDRRQYGFTIIEVLLFLGISGLLLVFALVGVNNSINNTRFNDAVNSTTSYLQRQYAEVSNGQNSRASSLGCLNGVINNTAATAGMTNCVVLGRLIQFNVGGSSLTARYIIGRDSANASLGDTAAVVAAAPTAVSGNGLDGGFDVPWSIQLNRMTQNSTQINYVAIIRSPVSERILFYSFQAANGLTNLTSTYIRDSNLNQPVNVCFRENYGLSARTGYIRIGAGQGQDIIRADLASTSGVCT